MLSCTSKQYGGNRVTKFRYRNSFWSDCVITIFFAILLPSISSNNITFYESGQYKICDTVPSVRVRSLINRKPRIKNKLENASFIFMATFKVIDDKPVIQDPRLWFLYRPFCYDALKLDLSTFLQHSFFENIFKMNSDIENVWQGSLHIASMYKTTLFKLI